MNTERNTDMYRGQDRRVAIEGRREDDFLYQRMLVLNSLLTEIGSFLEKNRILDRGVEGAVEMFMADGGFAVVPEEGKLCLRFLQRIGHDAHDVSFDDGPAVRRGLGMDVPILISDTATAGPMYRPLLDVGIRCLMAVPVVSGSIVHGSVVVVGRNAEQAFESREMELFKLLARGLDVAVNNSILFEEIKESQRQWQATFDCITDAILIQDENSVIQKSNVWAGQQCGVHPRDLVGMQADKVFSRPPSETEDPFARAMESGEASYFEAHQEGRDYLVSAFPVYDPRQGKRSCVHLRKDVTEIKRLQNQLFNTEKLLAVGRLVSGVAHEINNPLTGVIGYSELLLRKEGTNVFERELKKILESALRCKAIIENLLTFSRQKTQENQCVDINGVLDNTLELRSYWLRHGCIEVDRHYGELPPVMADPQQLQQVILNILTNAEQAIQEAHGGEGGMITLETFYANGRVLVSITDNGPGIPPDRLSKVFDPFFSTREVGQGAGLGLSSSYGIIREHGGDLRAQSSPGGGATFVIELPVETSSKAGDEAEDGLSVTDTVSGTCRPTPSD